MKSASDDVIFAGISDVIAELVSVQWPTEGLRGTSLHIKCTHNMSWNGFSKPGLDGHQEARTYSTTCLTLSCRLACQGDVDAGSSMDVSQLTRKLFGRRALLWQDS
jgi:hypothetical protein